MKTVLTKQMDMVNLIEKKNFWKIKSKARRKYY